MTPAAPGAAERLPLFVYGTLRPGGRYHRLYLDGRTTAERPARLAGAALYDGPGYPYAVPEPSAEIHGTVVVPAAEHYDAVLADLDVLEDEYEREIRAAALADGGTARVWVYLAAPPLADRLRRHGDRIPGGDWLTPRRPRPRQARKGPVTS